MRTRGSLWRLYRGKCIKLKPWEIKTTFRKDHMFSTYISAWECTYLWVTLTAIYYGFLVNYFHSEKIMKLYAAVFNSGIQVSDFVIRIRRIEIIFFKSNIFLLKIINYQDTWKYNSFTILFYAICRFFFNLSLLPSVVGSWPRNCGWESLIEPMLKRVVLYFQHEQFFCLYLKASAVCVKMDFHLFCSFS